MQGIAVITALGFLSFFLGGILVACATADTWAVPAECEPPSSKAAPSKISPPLCDVLVRLRQAGVDSETARTQSLRGFSTPLVRVDDRGRLHAFLHLSRGDPEILNAIARTGVAIELARSEPAVVQGWIPFDRMEDVARLTGVERVTAPDYAIPRP